MEFKFQTKFEFKQRRRKIKQKKGIEGKKAHSRLGLLGPPARSSRPAPLARVAVGRPNSRGQPSLRPSASPTPARLPAPLAAAATGPHLSAFLFIFSTPMPQLPARPEADSAGRSGPRGHARGMALFPLRHAYATTRGPLYAMHTPPPLDRRPPWVPWSSAIKAPAQGAPELSHRPATTLWPSTAHPSQERRGGRGRRRGSAKAARRRRCRWSGGRRPDQARRRCATLHCAAFGATWPQPATTSPSYLPRHQR